MISFSGGCVINLDDLQDFPDYFQVMSTLLVSIKQKKVDWKSMKTFLDAQIQDIQHMPQFMQLITQLTTDYKQIFTQSHHEHKQRCLVMFLKLSKNYFTSFTIQQQQIQPVLQILNTQLVQNCHLFCDFWLSISKFAAYIENHQLLLQFYLCVGNEKEMLSCQEMSVWYVKSMDKVLRFRAFRECFSKVISEKYKDKCAKFPFLCFKLSLYTNNNNQIKNRLKQLYHFIKDNQKSSKYILNYLQSKKKQYS